VFLSKINNSTIPQALRQHGITVKTAKPVRKFTGPQSLKYKNKEAPTKISASPKKTNRQTPYNASS
jgi:hypothetical protein